MSLRRPQKDCALCLLSLDEDVHRTVFYAYQEAANLRDAVIKIKEIGIDTTPEELRTHIQYHRPIQPQPHNRLRSANALYNAEALPSRLQAILSLVSRVPALSGTHLAEFFYWNGKPEHLASARAACYRDLSRLVKDNFLYRWYPPTTAGPTGARIRAWQHRLSFYFLGRDAVPLIEKTEGRTLSRANTDWVVSSDDLPEPHEVFAAGAAGESVAALTRQANRLAAIDAFLLGNKGRFNLELATDSWFGPKRLTGLNKSKQRPVWGLAAFRVYPQGGDEDFLSPFLYEYDDGLRPQKDVAESLLRFIDMKRNGSIGKWFPQLQKAHVFPPILLISSDPFRLESLRRSVQIAARKKGALTSLPIIVCCDQGTVNSGGISDESWISIWDKDATPKRWRLIDVLSHQSEALLHEGMLATCKLEIVNQ